MVTGSILLTLLLGSAPGPLEAPASNQICSPLPAEPHRIDTHPFANTAADGAQTWGVDATYQLSSGDTGEAFLVIDSEGAGEAQLMINGEIIAHVAMESPTSSEGPVFTTWMPQTVNAAPELIAEMMGVDLPAVLVESIPQEFKCSAFGKKAVKWSAALFRAATFGAGAACCVLSAPSLVGCVVCQAGVGTFRHYGGKALDEHCD
jgi:hypothetical protein